MALTTAVKRKAAKQFAAQEWESKQVPAFADKNELMQAIDDVATLLASAGTRTAVDSALSEPFKTDGSNADKAALVSLAAQSLAGRFG